MPYKSENIKIQGTQYDKRRRLTDEDRQLLLEDKGKLSQRAAARKYGISRRLVTFIWFPERLEIAKEQYKERRKSGIYYNKEKHTKSIREHRKRKQKLYLEGKIKLNSEQCQ